MKDEYRDSVQNALEKAFGVPANGKSLENQIDDVARTLATEYWNEHKREIIDILDNSYLEGYDELNTGVSFKNAATTSITYAI